MAKIDTAYRYSYGDIHRELPNYPRFGKDPKEGTQAEQLISLLVNQSCNTKPDEMWVPLPAIIRLGIAKYGTVITDLRNLGHTIMCRTKWVKKRGRMVKHSEFACPSWKAQIDEYRTVLRHRRSNRR